MFEIHSSVNNRVRLNNLSCNPIPNLLYGLYEDFTMSVCLVLLTKSYARARPNNCNVVSEGFANETLFQIDLIQRSNTYQHLEL